MTDPSLSGDLKTLARRIAHLRERIASFEAEPVVPKAIEFDRGELAALTRIVALVTDGHCEGYKARRRRNETQEEMLKGLEEVESLLAQKEGRR